MATLSLEERVAALEATVVRLSQERLLGAEAKQPWWAEIWGTFKNDSHYEAAMRLGREYRESLLSQEDDEEATV